jgi:uncharacterized protein (DUF924 family)
MTHLTPKDIIDFWFSDHAKPLQFAKNADFDQEIRDKFLGIYEEAYAGKLNSWKHTAEGSLALIIIMDQFPHNMFRNDARAWDAESTALAIAKEAREKGFHNQLTEEQLMFLHMPFMHSEDLADQELSLTLFNHSEFAISHHAIVKRFGRFPHRNIPLGRSSTPEEIEFLKEPGSSF